MIPITEDLKKSVRSVHSVYKAHLEKEKEMAERKKEGGSKKEERYVRKGSKGKRKID